MSSPILAFIIACEVGFWIIVVAGLLVRYRLRRPRAGAVVLWSVLILDLALLIAVGADLHGGASVENIHIIAGLYLGGSIAFGPRMVRWADARFAYHFAGGLPPVKAPKTGTAAVRYEWVLFGQWLIAALITSAAIMVFALTVADAAQRTGLYRGFAMIGVVTVLWFVSGPAWAMGRRFGEVIGISGR